MRILIDLDNVLVDFRSGIDACSEAIKDDRAQRKINGLDEDWDEVDGIFSLMEPMPGAVAAFKKLTKRHDVFIVSTAPWGNPSAWSDKLKWVKKHLGDCAEKRLILTHHKYLVDGDILIDDRRKRGAGAFKGLHILFGSDNCPSWHRALQLIDDVT